MPPLIPDPAASSAPLDALPAMPAPNHRLSRNARTWALG